MVCVIIVFGFLTTAYISYQTNWGVFEQDVERVSTLTSEGISHQIDSIFTTPLNTSLTMANDKLLKDFLNDESAHLNDEAFIQTMRSYLEAYREKYGFDSVFLASAKTSRYYHFKGLDRMLTQGNPENTWYYAFLNSHEEYSLNIDNDEAADNEITVFINCRITGPDGETMGIVGVGFRVQSLQAILAEYEDKFDIKAYLVDPGGMIEVATDRTGYESADLFQDSAYSQLKSRVLADRETKQDFWYSGQNQNGYLVAQYIPNLEWFLLIDHDTSNLERQLQRQMGTSVAVVIAVIAFVLLTITGIIRKYNDQIIQLTVAREQEHQSVYQKVAESLYEAIFEVDITHDQAASEETRQHFSRMGAPDGVSYTQALEILAEKQVKEEFRQDYIDTLSRDNILNAYRDGITNLRFDFMAFSEERAYCWKRITIHIFFWSEDSSVRILVYKQNIDAEKRREFDLYNRMQQDPLTGLFNKAATQERIRSQLQNSGSGERYAFYILDIDNFKQVNDRFGHASGDKVLVEFADLLGSQFQIDDLTGRIGGDEFVAFQSVPDREAAVAKAQELSNVLRFKVETEKGPCTITASVGVAITPEAGTEFETLYRNADTALYQTKKQGKCGFTVYSSNQF